MEPTEKRLVQKSIEVFLLAIEIYNKPTIKYRVEGFALFIVNAWELLLKAHLIKTKGEDFIYFKDNTNRTITLSMCIKEIFSNEKDPLRINLEKIIELRNTSTHFITEEYEYVYIPLFQANVFNFCTKLKEFHNEEITDYMPENFLTLSVTFSSLNENQIKAKYSNQVSARLIELTNKLEKLKTEHGSRFAITVEHKHYLTKKKNEATETFSIAKDQKDAVFILNKPQDPQNTHPYTAKEIIRRVNQKLNTENVKLAYHGNQTKLNMHHFTNICKAYSIKSDKEFCYTYTIQKNLQYSYSQKALDFIVGLLKKNPDSLLDTVARRSKK
jgi:hypothetical protein